MKISLAKEHLLSNNDHSYKSLLYTDASRYSGRLWSNCTNFTINTNDTRPNTIVIEAIVAINRTKASPTAYNYTTFDSSDKRPKAIELKANVADNSVGVNQELDYKRLFLAAEYYETARVLSIVECILCRYF